MIECVRDIWRGAHGAAMQLGKAQPTAVDLRALTLSAAAASPLFAWNIADALSSETLLNDSIVQIAIDQVQLVVHLIVAAFGNVFVALGGALFLQRNAPRLRPFSFTATALAIVGLLVALNAVVLGFELLATEIYSSSAAAQVIRQRVLVSLILSNTALLAVVGVAARLYIGWRREPPDPKDSARFVVFAGVGLALALAYIVWRMIAMISTPYTDALTESVPIIVLWWMQGAAVSIVDSLGAVFFVGSIAIAWVRRVNVEDNLGWVTMGALAASLAYWLVVYGPTLAQAMPYLNDPDLVWTQPHLRALLAAIAVGLIGGPLYLHAVNRDALRKAFANVPTSIRALRSWPYRPSEDE